MLTKSITDMNVKQECVSPADDFFQSVTDRWTDGQTDRMTDDGEVIPKCLHAMQATQLGTTIAYLVPDSETKCFLKCTVKYFTEIFC